PPPTPPPDRGDHHSGGRGQGTVDPHRRPAARSDHRSPRAPRPAHPIASTHLLSHPGRLATSQHTHRAKKAAPSPLDGEGAANGIGGGSLTGFCRKCAWTEGLRQVVEQRVLGEGEHTEAVVHGELV